MSTRVDVVADELKARLERMKAPAAGRAESAYEKARREALVAAEADELRLLLRAILSGAERRQGAIPFARDAEGRPYAPDPRTRPCSRGSGSCRAGPRRAATRGTGWWPSGPTPRPAS